MIRVVIADDHAIVRRGLVQLITETSDLLLVGEATNGAQVIDLVRREKPDVVVLDISMPGRNGIDVLEELKRMNRKIAALVLSIYPEEQYAVRAMRAGAAGYLSKEAIPEELLNAIRKVYRGGKYISVQLADTLAQFLERGDDVNPHEKLSNREFQILVLIASGKTPSEIALELSLSVKTVSTYRSRILEKMGLKSNAMLTRYVIEKNLLE